MMQVPGEMFGLALKAEKERGMGVVGSTANILDFIGRQVEAAKKLPFPTRIQVCSPSSFLLTMRQLASDGAGPTSADCLGILSAVSDQLGELRRG
jgi:hypothetical protein